MMFVQEKTNQPGWMNSLQIVDACNEFEFFHFPQFEYIATQQFSTVFYHFNQRGKNTLYACIGSGPDYINMFFIFLQKRYKTGLMQRKFH